MDTGRSILARTAVRFAHPLAVENADRKMEMTPESGNDIVLGGVRHELLQFLFRRGGEPPVGASRSLPEMHVVHRSGYGGLAGIGVPFTQGETSDAPASAWAHFPPDPGVSRVLAGKRDLAALLPSMRTTWRYTGSLTTTPCTERVAWVISAEPLSMSAAQIAAFAAIDPHNCRSAQPLGEGILYRGSSACPERQEGLE